MKEETGWTEERLETLKNLWNDGLEVGFASREFSSFLQYEAY